MSRVRACAPAALRTWLVLAFSVFCLPALLPEGREAALLGPAAQDPEAMARLRADLDLGRPLPLRFVVWLTEVVRGDLGRSYVRALDVGREVGRHLPLTVGLTALTVLGVRVVADARRRRGRRSAPLELGPVVVVGVLAVEALCDWPGLGRATREAAGLRDFVVLQGVLLAVATLGLLVAWLAPPERSERPEPPPGAGRESPSSGPAWTASGWLVLFPAVAALAPRLPFDNPERLTLDEATRGVGTAHWLGTDELGRDLLARVVYAGRDSLLLAVAGAGVALAVGLLLAGVRRSAARESAWFLPRMALPAATVGLALAAFEDRPVQRMGLWLAPAAVGGTTAWFRSNAGGWRRPLSSWRGDREGARALVIGLAGAGLGAMAAVLLLEAALAMLGLGADTTLSFGSLLAAGRGSFPRAPLPVFVPAGVLALTVWALRVAARHCDALARVGSAPLPTGTMAG